MRRYLILVGLALLISCSGTQKFLKHEKSEDKAISSEDYFEPIAVSHFIRGCIYDFKGDHKSALIEFNQALLHDSSSATIYGKVAEQYIKLDSKESAEKILKEAILKHPHHVESYKILAAIYYHRHDFDNAEKLYQKIVEIEPNDIEVHYNLIAVYMNKNDELKVAAEYEKILELGSGNSDMQIKVGNLYLQNGKYDKAESIFNAFIEEYPDDERSYLAMAKLNLVKKDTTSAMNWYLKGISADSSFTTCLEELRDLYILQKNWDDAISLLQNFVMRDSSDIEMRLRLGELYYRKQDSTAAVNEFSKIIQEFPDDFRAYFSIGAIYYQKRNWIDAIHYYKNSIKVKEDFYRGWLMLGLAYLRADSIQAAENNFQTAVELFPDDPDINYFLGTVLNQRQKYEESAIYLARSLKLEPDNVDAMSALALAYDELGYYAKSDSLYESALELRKEDPLLMNNYSYSLSERSVRLEYALQMSRTAVTQDSTNGAYLDTLGWIYYKMGNYPEALKYIKLSIKHRQASAEVLEHLGDVYLKLNNIENARKKWQEAFELDNTRTWLIEKLDDAK